MEKYLHFCPSDGWFGDAMPFYKDGIYHIYYTKLNKERPMSWGHIATRDFVSYDILPDPFIPGEHHTPYNTGCVYFKDGKYYAYFQGSDDENKFGFYVSESDDGVTFSQPGKLCFLRNDKWYRDDDTCRDPQIMYDEKDCLYHLVFCAKIPQGEKPDCNCGVVGHAVSNDLLNWECLEPLKLRGVATSIECPDLFYENGAYRLGYYWHETRFRSSDSIGGEWRRGNVISPDGFDFMAAKQCCDGNRRVLIGWLPRKNCDCAERIWGGNMLIPRELYFENDTPKTKFIKEIDAFFPNKANKDDIKISASDCGKTELFADMNENFRLKFNFKLENENGTLALLFGLHRFDDCDLDSGYALIFDIPEGILRLREHYKWDQRNDIAVCSLNGRENKKISVDMIYDNGILEVCIDNEKSLVCRLMKPTSGGVAFYAQDCNAKIKDITVFY